MTKSCAYILFEESYSENEVAIADEIRSISDEDERSSQIEAFEFITSKKFPFVKPIKLEFNLDTAFIGSFPSKSHIGNPQLKDKHWWK